MKPSSRTRKFRTASLDAGQTLGGWLAARLGIPGDAARALVEGGSVYVDGRRTRDPDIRLRAAHRIAVHEAAAPLAVELAVLHEDAEILVVDKPARLPTMAGRESAHALDALVGARFPGATPMHRLDRDASGLVLFARSDAARARLQQALQTGAVDREYAAFADGHPAEDGFTIASPIGPDPHDHRRQRAGPGGREAVTHVAVMLRGHDPTGGAACELRVLLETGRTHQIRVHLASAGHPLLGDVLYAPPEVCARAPRLALHATRLRWPGGEATSPIPLDLRGLVR